MTRKMNLLALLGAAAVTVLAIASFSNAASSATPVNTALPKITRHVGGGGPDADGELRHVDELEHADLQVPMAALRQAGKRLLQHLGGRLVDVSAEVGRRRSHGACARHRDQLGRLDVGRF